MGILDLSKFELSIKSWKFVSTDPPPPPKWKFQLYRIFWGIGKCANHLSPDRGRLVKLCTVVTAK